MENCFFKYDSIIDRISMTLITLFSFFLIIAATLTPTQIAGESDDYMIATISLQNRGSLRILESDIEQAKSDFPEHYEYIKSSYDEMIMSKPVKAGAYFAVKEGEIYPWYMGTYSLSCIPMKIILKALRLNQSYAFSITNVLFYILALLTVFFKLKANRINVFLTIVMLVFSPAVYYYFWPSAEIFMFSLVVMSLVFFINKNHKLAGLFVSTVGSLNSTIMVYGAVILVDYFMDIYKRESIKGNNKIYIMIRNNFKDIILTGMCFLPSIFTFMFNYFKFGIFNLQEALHFADYSFLFQRFVSYLFDLNLGFLPYFIIAFPLYIIFTIRGFLKKDRYSILFAISFFGTIFAYSIMSHINCGMTGISRYGAWSFPIFVFYLTTCSDAFMTSPLVKRFFIITLVISALLTGSVSAYSYMENPGLNDSKFSPIADMILSNAPQLYNPLYSIFQWKITTIAGGYEYFGPVAYINDEGYVTKILVTPETAEKVKDMVVGRLESLEKLQEKIDKIKKKVGYRYINIASNEQITLSKRAVFESIKELNNGVLSIENLQYKNSDLMKDFVSVHPNGLQYGPYIELPRGMYKVTIYGNHLIDAEIFLSKQSGEVSIPFNILELSESKVMYEFELDEIKNENLEFILKNRSNKDIIIKKIILE